MNPYIVRKTDISPTPADDFNSPIWSKAETITLENRYLGSHAEHGFTPHTSCRLLYGNGYIFGRYLVKDKYILIRAVNDQDSVCLDSCVEFFVSPKGGIRYFNFEFSGGGSMLLYSMVPNNESACYHVSKEDCASVIRYSTLPRHVDPETTEPVDWQFYFAIPVSFFVKHTDLNLDTNLSGQVWTANVTKCADHCSHPCWLSWQPLPKLNYHQPECFTKIQFE